MPKNLQTLFVILEPLRGGRLLTLELHSESWVLDRITFPDVLLSMHHKKLPSTRFQLQCFLFQGLTDSGIYIIIVTTQGGMRCLIILFVFGGFCPEVNLMEMAVSVCLWHHFTVYHFGWVVSTHESPLQWQSEHNCAGKKKHQSDLTWSTSCLTT